MKFIYTSMYKNRNGIKQMKEKKNSHDNIYKHSKLSKISNDEAKKKRKKKKGKYSNTNNGFDGAA